MGIVERNDKQSVNLWMDKNYPIWKNNLQIMKKASINCGKIWKSTIHEFESQKEKKDYSKEDIF